MSTKDGGPAFPVADYDHMVFEPKTVAETKRDLSGMSLRDYFAAKASIEVYAPADTLYRRLGRNPTVNELAEWIAEVRYIEADFMIARRSQP